MSERFRPARAGVINLWDYRDEEFVFAGGRLVLRGDNGSGKTKALEVLFPFVLDGRIEPRRLNPFASEERTMRSNLLYRGQQAAYGYVWIEFRSGAEAVTVGVGLRASRHSDEVKRWYFVTDGRVGVDFSLLSADERPLTRKELVEQIGADAIRDRSSEHRTAVDARLFGLGQERFEQLLRLVLTLRRPQLAKDLDPVKLSDTLADGLRPLDDTLLAEAARSFDDMEAVARTLEGLVRADDAAAAFLGTYSTYVRSHARLTADALTVRRESATARRGELVDARERRGEAERRLTTTTGQVNEAELAVASRQAHLDQLKTGPAFDANRELAALQRAVDAARSALDAASERGTGRRTNRERAERDVTAASTDAARLDAEAGRVAADLSAEATTAGIPWSAGDAAAAGFAERAEARVAAREDDVHAVRRAIAELGTAEHARRSAATAAERADADEQAAVEALRQASNAVDTARSMARQRLAAWVDRHGATVDELAVPGLIEDLAATIDTAGEPDAPTPPAVFQRATAAAVQAQQEELARLRQERARIAAEVAELEERRTAVAAERDDAPPRFAARVADRTRLTGGPLWRLVRFADHLSGAESAGIEAALEAANLLDAWIPAEPGAVPDGDGHLVPLPAAARPGGRTLASVLVPEDTDLVDPARVGEVLSSIALLAPGAVPAPGSAPSITPEGRFVQGVQVGAFTKPAAEYVGATARARRRTARLADLATQIAAAMAHLDATDRLVSRGTDVLAAAAAATAELPRLGAIVEARRQHDQAAGGLRERRKASEQARSAFDQAVAEASAKDRALRKVAADRSLPPADVDGVAAAVDRFDKLAIKLAGVRERSVAAHEKAEQERERLDRAYDEEQSAIADADRAHLTWTTESERLHTQQERLGADAAKVLADIAAAEAQIKAAQSARTEATKARENAIRDHAAASTEAEAAVTALRTALVEEQAEARRLEPFADPDLLAILRCPTTLAWPARHEDWPDPTGDTPEAALPPAVAALHDGILAATRDLSPTEASVKQATTRLTKALDELSTELSAAGHDYRPEWESVGGLIVVRIADEHGLAPVGAFGERIASARRDQEQLLTESERRVLEDALLTQLARQIHERTVDARDLINRMNTEMRRRGMSSGLTVGVRWELADSLADEQRDIVRLMERDAASLGPDELARMRAFFAGSIKAARAARPDRGYRQVLADVLDYRRWRSFSFFLHPPGGGEERLTRARHGQLSGGEQSVSLHLPLFAAAHVTFNSADPRCPRLLALDEAFAGVDDKGRTELFGLTTEFDFDLFMTGFDLWATYDTVPGAAHYDLKHSPAEHAVSALLMVWDGTGTDADVDGSLAAALGSPLTRRRPTRGAGLLDELEPADA